MFEWHKTIQRMVKIVEQQISRGADDDLTLKTLAGRLGYSRFHVTRQFKTLTGMTFRNYLGLRRLALSVMELRDSECGIIDIAMKYGFSSQEAYTRAFKKSFGITPCVYRHKPVPLVLQGVPVTFDPYFLGLGESSVNKTELQEIRVSVITLPAHKFLHLKNIGAKDYFSFWALQEHIPGQDCDTITGLLDSISSKLDSVTGKTGEFDGQIGGWYYDDAGQMGYCYGIRLPADYKGELPKQMQCVDIPQRDYLAISHPPFDYEKIWGSVYDAVERVKEEYDYTKAGQLLDMSGFTYQVVNPEHFGYRVYIPIK